MKKKTPEAIRKQLGLEIATERKIADLKQTDVAKLSGLNSPVSISRVEAGIVLPGDKLLRKIALAIGLDEFRFVKRRDELLCGECSDGDSSSPADVCRRPWNLTGSGTLHEIYASDSADFDIDLLKAEVSARIARYSALEQNHNIRMGDFDKLEPRIQNLPPLEGNVGYWASSVRAYLHVGDTTPLSGLAEILERHGVRVFFSGNLGEASSKSFYELSSMHMPVIVLNRNHTSERLLNYLAMEVAQICLWCRNGQQPLASRELYGKLVQKFAAELLVPRDCIEELMKLLNLPKEQWTLPLVCQAKLNFGVSASMFLHRLEELELIAGDLCTSILDDVRNSYGTSEPEPRIAPEVFQTERWYQLLLARDER